MAESDNSDSGSSTGASAGQAGDIPQSGDGWNYFNYFTEIEEYFWKKRGAHLLVSPLDWAIVETWQKAGVPLDAALKGIDAAFESYQRSKRGAGKPLKSLAYCTDAVMEAAQEQLEGAAGSAPTNGATPNPSVAPARSSWRTNESCPVSSRHGTASTRTPLITLTAPMEAPWSWSSTFPPLGQAISQASKSAVRAISRQERVSLSSAPGQCTAGARRLATSLGWTRGRRPEAMAVPATVGRREAGGSIGETLDGKPD